ncbi:MAG: tRNA (N(6)-L-threonylcarbamoyladenosine(37)-C(2))-methylthiotransferase MtaB [Lachnospiraceae bacterium]|nr:tRNA (N(6)-L-threonylcarbamoyladenosine(37)-C(2))-methylthiotransferase MtaB [Lachnospiraceae bacterium]
MKTVAFHNLGCKVNSYELDAMQQYFQKSGYSIVDFAQKADIYVVNTCTVTNIADRKSRQMIHKAKAMNPEAVVVAVGCYVQTHQGEIEKDESIDLAIGNNKKKDIVELVETFLSDRKGRDKTLGGISIPDLEHAPAYEEISLEQTAEHTRAYIKIQDGCNQFCSYCAIPYARGRVRSRRPEHILEEARTMVSRGYREVVITGIHISSYGLDFDGTSYNSAVADTGVLDGEFSHAGHLLEVIKRLDMVEGLERIRLGSLEPRIITEGFIKELSACKKICPHFHLSLQSGCDSVLERMNRRYTCEDFRRGVEVLRSAYDRPAITTDLIAGFPGESEEEFARTLSFVESIGFYETHIFPFSRRKGTVADRLPGQLTEKQKKERCAALARLNEAQSKAYRGAFLTSTQPVLFERTKQIGGASYLTGHTPNYIEVAVRTSGEAPGEELIGQIRPLLLADFLEDEVLLGEFV